MTGASQSQSRQHSKKKVLSGHHHWATFLTTLATSPPTIRSPIPSTIPALDLGSAWTQVNRELLAPSEDHDFFGDGDGALPWVLVEELEGVEYLGAYTDGSTQCSLMCTVTSYKNPQ